MPALTVRHADGVAIITIDLPNEPVNKVTAGLRAEFASMFPKLESDSTVRAIVLGIRGRRTTRDTRKAVEL